MLSAWCRRALSLGADGVLVLVRRNARVELEHYNADGTRSSLCLNGSRCAARLAFALGWAEDAFTLWTDAGPLACRDLGTERARVELPAGLATAPRRMRLPLDPSEQGPAVDGWFLQVGVPHFVVEHESLADLKITDTGPALRAHPALGAAGANVDFVRFVDRETLRLRTYERGVEAETLACGTGVVAAAVVGLLTERVDSALTAETAGGFALDLEFDLPELDSSDTAEHRAALDRPIRCSGDARLVATGELLAGAASVPRRPGWMPSGSGV